MRTADSISPWHLDKMVGRTCQEVGRSGQDNHCFPWQGKQAPHTTEQRPPSNHLWRLCSRSPPASRFPAPRGLVALLPQGWARVPRRRLSLVLITPFPHGVLPLTTEAFAWVPAPGRLEARACPKDETTQEEPRGRTHSVWTSQVLAPKLL